MPEYIGPILIPEISASGTFPVTVHFGTARQYAPDVVIHRFGTLDARVEQRYYRGPGLKRITVNCASMTESERDDLMDFLEDRGGSYQPFTLPWKENDGTTTNLTVRLVSPSWALDKLREGEHRASIELVEEPSADPSYSVSSTLTRFPSTALKAALLSQAQEIIPLVTITAGGYTIRLSDRRVTVDGNLYQPRILSFDGISQTMGEASDIASFTLGNADRVFTDLVGLVDLDRATVTFSLFHVGSTTLVNLWAGHLASWEFDASGEFRIQARDGVSALRLAYPRRTISRQDGFVVGAQPVSVGGKKGISRITATSVSNDTAYGKPLKDVWVNNLTAPLPVPCDVIAGRDESEFYAALGVIGRGPISAFGTGHTLDGQVNHGPGSYGLRRSYGGDSATGSEALTDNSPDQGSNWFALDSTSTSYPQSDAGPTGAAFLQIRRTDEKGVQALRPSERQMVAYVSQGLGGWVWSGSGPYTRTWTAALTNRAWVAINTWLNALGLASASQSAQEATFDVDAAIAAAAICAETVDKLIGTGTETQFTFTGIVGSEERTLSDWLRDILAGCLGYYTTAYGKLKLGIRVNSSVVEAFTLGNIVYGSLHLASRTPEFNHLTVGFADEDYEYAGNTLTIEDTDHIAQSGQTLKANVNLLGVTSKSQAARVCTVAFREAMGGLRYAGTVNTSGTAVAWVSGTKFVAGMDGQTFTIAGTDYVVDSVTDDENIVLTTSAGTQTGAAYSASYEIVQARRGSFKTTILALNVEPGMVCSLTHDEMSGGSGEFRVQSWRLNPDWSIDVEWVTTWDSMYNTAVGPKPDDVEPDELPYREPWPIDVTGSLGSNLLTNPGFERGLTNWHGMDVASGFDIVETGQDTGMRCLKVSALEACEIHQPYAFADGENDVMPCAPGDQFAFTGRYKFDAASAASVAQARVAFYDASGTYLDAATATLDTADTTWSDFSIEATAPASAKYMGIFPWFGTLTAGAVYLDTLVCKEPASVLAPGHVTDLTLGSGKVVSIRGQEMLEYVVNATAPEASTYNGFNAIWVYHTDENGIEIPHGPIPVTAAAGVAFEVTLWANRPQSLLISEYIRVLSDNGVTRSDYDTAPTAENIIGGSEVAAGEPISTSLTLIGDGGTNFACLQEWVKPVPRLGTIGYDRKIEIYTDSGGTTIESTILPGAVMGYDVERAMSDFQSIVASRWIQGFVRGYNLYGSYSDWVASGIQVLEIVSGTVVPQPEADDWSLGTVLYGAEEGRPKVGLPVNVITIPVGCDVVTVWMEIDGEWRDVLSAGTTGEHVVWLFQPTIATEYPTKLIGNSTTVGFRLPSDLNDIKTFSVAATGKALQALTFAVTQEENPATQQLEVGKKFYRLLYEATWLADPNRWGCVVEARWTDASWTPVSGDAGSWTQASDFKSDALEYSWYSSTEYLFGAPKDNAEYRQFRLIPINEAGERTEDDAIVVNLTRNADGGFKATAIDGDTLGAGIVLTATGIASSQRGQLKNGDFEDQDKDWSLGTDWSIVAVDQYSGSYCAKGVGSAAGTWRALRQDVPCVPEQEFWLEAYCRSTLNVPGSLIIVFWDASGNAVRYSDIAYIDGDTYQRYTCTGIAPATAVKVSAYVELNSSHTSGRVLVDQVRLELLEPVVAGLSRGDSGLSNTDRNLKNGDFEYGSADWSYSAGVSFTTTDAFKGTAAKLDGDGTGPSLYQTFSVFAEQVLRLEGFARESGNSTSQLYIEFFNAAGTSLGAYTATISGDTYDFYAVVAAAPANSATAKVGATCPAANTSGRLMVDNLRLLFLEPAQGALTRGASGIDITLDSDYLIVAGGELTTVAAGILDKLGIDTGQFTKSGGFLAVNAIAVNYLAAGSAVFTGDVVFSRSSGGSMTLNTTGIQISGGGSTLSLASGGAEIPLLATGSYASPSIASNTSGNVFYKTASFASGCAVNFNSGSTISIDSSIRSSWRTQLGLGTIATENVGLASDSFSAGGYTWTITNGLITGKA